MARSIYKVLGGENYKELGYCRAIDQEDKIRVLINQLKGLGVDIRYEGHQKVVSVKQLKVDARPGLRSSNATAIGNLQT